MPKILVHKEKATFTGTSISFVLKLIILTLGVTIVICVYYLSMLQLSNSNSPPTRHKGYLLDRKYVGLG